MRRRATKLRPVLSSCILLLLLAFMQARASAQENAPSRAPQADSGSTSPSQSRSDLADAARRAREEREQQRVRRSADSEAVTQMANDLAEESEQDGTAPVGFRYYRFKAGDYSILVPADAEVDGRDGHGLKLLSADAMTSRTLVILGDPIAAAGSTADEILRNAILRYFPGCKVGLYSAGKPVNGHAAGSMGISCALGNSLLGSAEFVLGDGAVMPVICGYPMTSEDLDPNPHRPIGVIVRKYDRESRGYRACDLILPSLRFHEHGARLKTAMAEGTGKKPVMTGALLNANATPGGGGSLGSFARAHKKAASGEVLTELKHAAPGFTPYHFRYCSQEECFAATLEIPLKARLDQQFRVDYAGLFAFLVPVGDAVAVIQATKGAPTKLGFLTREQFINTKVDWWIENVPAANFRGAGKAEVLDEELTTLAYLPARLSTFRSPTLIQSVMTKLAAYMAPGVFVQIRCSVPEKAYGDAQLMCEHVVRSLEVAKAKELAEEEAADPPAAPEDNDP